MPKGWTTPRPGYWGENEDGRDTLSAIETYRGEAAAWEAAFNKAVSENEAFRAEMVARFEGLEKAIEKERAGWKREIRRAKGPGFGLFAGYGLNDRGDGDFVFGAGVVWKIW